MDKFCDSLTRFSRRPTDEVRIGTVGVGGDNPIRLQSMTNTDTNDTEASAAQVERIAAAGGEIVRLTAQGRREAANLGRIRALLDSRGCRVPLVADIHFLPAAALVAAEQVEKVRINPGNWNERGGEFDELLSTCRRRGVALRIGVNHGSLSPSIMERYGDTVEGMVASAMEYLRRCREASFGQVVVSIKSSNVRVMVQAYRMLVAAMRREGMRYPLHLGVTEAGDDREGRVKSAVGIGALLCDGIGDTIRVSLTEAPEREIPVARTLAARTTRRSPMWTSRCTAPTSTAAACRPRRTASEATFRPSLQARYPGWSAPGYSRPASPISTRFPTDGSCCSRPTTSTAWPSSGRSF